MIQQRDLLLVPFPFSDQSGRKVRPVVVITNNHFNEYSEDVLVVGVTSNVSKEKNNISLGNGDLEEGKLITNCVIKVENILRLDKSLIVKKIGKIKSEKHKQIIKIINELIAD